MTWRDAALLRDGSAVIWCDAGHSGDNNHPRVGVHICCSAWRWVWCGLEFSVAGDDSSADQGQRRNVQHIQEWAARPSIRECIYCSAWRWLCCDLRRCRLQLCRTCSTSGWQGLQRRPVPSEESTAHPRTRGLRLLYDFCYDLGGCCNASRWICRDLGRCWP